MASAALIAAGLLSSSCDSRHEKYPLPHPNEITAVRVKLFGEFLNEADSSEFEIPRKELPTVLKILSREPVRLNQGRDSGSAIIKLELDVQAGSPVKIEVPWSGKNKLSFSVDGIPCEREGSYGKVNFITGEPTAFAPDESLLFYQYLKSWEPAQ